MVFDTGFVTEAKALGETLNEGNRSYLNDAQTPALVADGRQTLAASRDAATSVVDANLPATTAAVRTGIAANSETFKSAADSTTATAKRVANAYVVNSAGALLLGALNASSLQRQSRAMEIRARVGIANHGLAHQASIQGSAGQDRASWVVEDAISILRAVLQRTHNSEHLRPIIILVGDYHDTHPSIWSTINNASDRDRALFPEEQLVCLVTNLPAAIESAVGLLASHTQSSSEKTKDIKSPHFFFLLRGHGDIQFSQAKQRHKVITIPYELSQCVSIIGRGGRGDLNAHALHMDSKVEERPRVFVSIFKAKRMFWYVDAWRSGVSLCTRATERIGWRNTVGVGGTGGIASAAGAWGVNHALHVGALLTGTAFVLPGAAVYSVGEVVSRWRSEDYTVTEACRLLGVD